MGRKKKRKKEKSDFIEDMSLLSSGKSLEGLHASTRVVKEEIANYRGRCSKRHIKYLRVNGFHR